MITEIKLYILFFKSLSKQLRQCPHRKRVQSFFCQKSYHMQHKILHLTKTKQISRISSSNYSSIRLRAGGKYEGKLYLEVTQIILLQLKTSHILSVSIMLFCSKLYVFYILLLCFLLCAGVPVSVFICVNQCMDFA